MTSPAHPGPWDSRFPTHWCMPPQSLPPQETPAQHPPSETIPLSPGHVKQQCVHHYREPRQTYQPKNIRDLGAVAVGTRFRGQRNRKAGELGGLLCDRGRKGPGNPLSTRHSPTSWARTIIPRRRWQQYWPSFRRPSGCRRNSFWGSGRNSSPSTPHLVTIVGVLKDLVNTRRDTVAQQGAPDISLDDEQPTTSAGASGQEAPPQDHDTSTPPPADGEPPRKRYLRSRTKNNAKTPATK
ncbi:hypothetical protein NDU88_002122 [Pleurodeles waltl]|uniref:Uncharacterized protein n=1 Tax=Pleurodeles waltl TaxID=8319 RepID=A0AAV7UWB1_PLEWA|nr:hypothetical protein NDU88_002122 [Pleurodeles waltl]